MCEFKTIETRPGHIERNCELTGKPITVTKDSGMYCEDMCGEVECDAAMAVGNAMIASLDKLFNR